MNVFSCKQVAQAISASLDRSPSFREHVVIRLHLMMCSFCRRFQRQIRFLRLSARQFVNQPLAKRSNPHVNLGLQARQRIKQALRDREDGAGDPAP
ncbi:MAG: zf-HC2 domain-containing protein [Planctomycetaceae bacterium]